MTNAFASTDTQPREDAVTSLTVEPKEQWQEHRTFFRQRMVNPLVRVTAADGSEVCAVPGSGNIIGSIEGPRVFIKAFNESCAEYRRGASTFVPTITANGNFKQEEKIPLNDVIFADDSASVLVSESGQAEETAALLIADDQLFDAVALQGGWAQNRSKKDLVASLRSTANRNLHSCLFEAFSSEAEDGQSDTQEGTTHTSQDLDQTSSEQTQAEVTVTP